MVKAEVCKTSIQRFESARRLHARSWLTGWLVPLLVLAALPGIAGAAQILQLKPYSGNFDFTGYDPFDPASGTLDEVRVSIDGTLSGVVATPPNLIGPGGTPVPYSVLIQAEQLWFGPGSRGFDFSTPARLTLSRVATGAGGSLSFSQPYSIAFKFDATTDLIGFTPVSSASGVQPPLTVVAQRSNFIKSIVNIDEADYVHPLFTATPPAFPAAPAQAAGLLTLDYRFTPPPPTFPPLVFQPITSPLLPGPLVSTVGTASYLGIDTGLLTDSSRRRSAEVRGSISPGENLLTDQSGARAASEIGGQVRALARAAGQPLAVPAGDPELSASSTARQISQWLVMSDSLAPGTVVDVDVLLQVEGTLQAAEGSVAPGSLVAGDVFAFVAEKLSLFREVGPGTLLHEGGGTLDAVAGLTEAGGWSFSLLPGSPPTAAIDETILLEDLFTVTIGETFALELSLRTDAFALDPLDRFALADFFQDGRGVSLTLASDQDAAFALRAVPGPAAAIPALPLIGLVALLLAARRRGRTRRRGPASS